MNKTITINLAGLVFNIEENAYQILKDYLSAIKNHFRNEEGCEEIVADIESRLAELLKANTHAGKQVLIEADINAAINTMGKPEEFTDGAEEETHSASQEQRSNSSKTTTRRVFRDGDNRMLGGVCSGIANYFDTDPLWIRLILVVLFFGFGSGLLLYIILWIIIPEAKTTAEKLEMHGDPIDINTISQTVKEEAEQLKNRMHDFGKGVKKEYQYQKKSGVGNKIGNLIYTIFHGLFTVISKVVGVFFVFFGLVLFVALLAVLFGFGNVDGLSMHSFLEAVGGENFSFFYFKLGLILCVGIPLSMLVYKGMKLILGIKVRYRWLNLSAGMLWFAGLVICSYIGMRILNDYSSETQLKDQLKISSQANDTLYVKANNNYTGTATDADFRWNRDRWLISSTETPMIWWGSPNVKIITSENDSLSVFMIKSSQGVDKPDAAQRAKKINYKLSQQDSSLLVDNYFSFTGTDKFRNQEVNVLIKLPKNKVVYLDKSLSRLLYDVENTNGITDSEMGGKYWKMTENGLTCLSCTAEDLKNNSDEVTIEDEDGHVRIDKDGIEVNAKDAHVKISKEGIHIHEKNNADKK
jgi:phage shock protein PspC (stress-responsive transcriptional regulator)